MQHLCRIDRAFEVVQDASSLPTPFLAVLVGHCLWWVNWGSDYLDLWRREIWCTIPIRIVKEAEGPGILLDRLVSLGCMQLLLLVTQHNLGDVMHDSGFATVHGALRSNDQLLLSFAKVCIENYRWNFVRYLSLVARDCYRVLFLIVVIFVIDLTIFNVCQVLIKDWLILLHGIFDSFFGEIGRLGGEVGRLLRRCHSFLAPEFHLCRRQVLHFLGGRLRARLLLDLYISILLQASQRRLALFLLLNQIDFAHEFRT